MTSSAITTIIFCVVPVSTSVNLLGVARLNFSFFLLSLSQIPKQEFFQQAANQLQQAFSKVNRIMTMDSPSFLRHRLVLCCLFLLQCQSSRGFSTHAVLSPVVSSSTTILNVAAQKDDQSVAQQLMARAQQLREEAGALETKLRSERPLAVAGHRASSTAVTAPVEYNTIANSVWKLTYRFADQPVNNNNGRDENDDEEDSAPVESFRGQITLRFQEDGYTEIIPSEDDNGPVRIEKVWGWDQELEIKDGGRRYVLFSMDAKTPNKRERFYFQAEVQKKQGTIALKEGTVTIKEDLAKTKKMMNFGFFAPKGMLVQFRYVGDFIAKPVDIPQG